MSECVLITGADGYCGRLLTEKFLFHSNKNLMLWFHATDISVRQAQYQRLLNAYSEHKNRLHVYSGDLRSQNPFGDVKPSEITSIVHSATVNRFNIDKELAMAFNREGVRKIAFFARACPRLERLSLISSIYSAGLPSGCISESTIDPNRLFANHFERSMCEAEFLLQSEFSQLPWSIFRMPIFIAHDKTGKVIQYNVFHHTMRLIFYGMISLLPGKQSTPIFLSIASSAIDAIFAIMSNQSVFQGFYNVCDAQDKALTWGQLIDRVFLNFSANAEFYKNNTEKPVFTDIVTFESSAAVLKGLSGAEVRMAINSLQSFARQLFVDKSLDNKNLMQAFPGYESAEMMLLIDNIVQYLMITKWGAWIDKKTNEKCENSTWYYCTM